MKNKFWKKSMLLSLPLAFSAIVLPIAITSCNQNTTQKPGNGGGDNSDPSKVASKTFEVFEQATRQSTNDVNKDAKKMHIDPNFNKDAMSQAKQTFQAKLTKENLQEEFNKVLTKFYQANEYEYEKDDGKTETEIEADLKRITVTGFDKEKLQVTVNAEYKVETETETQDKDDNKKDKEEVKKETQSKTITLNPMFASKTEIKSIEKMLKSHKDKDNNQGSFEIDVDDLWELYVGEKDDKKDSIFEQVDALTTQNNLGGLLGYGIKMSDLQYTPKNNKQSQRNKKIDQDTVIFAPSSIIKDYYVPEIPKDEPASQLDLTFDYDKLSQKTKEDVKAINDASGLSGILLKELTEEQKKLINSVSITEETIQSDTNSTNSLKNSVLKVEVTIKESSSGTSMPTIAVLYIQESWLKPTTPAEQEK